MMLRFYDLNLALRRQNYFLKRSRRRLSSSLSDGMLIEIRKSLFFRLPKGVFENRQKRERKL